MTDGTLPRDVIDRIREASDIVAEISKHLTLKPKGQEYWGLCPFHTEKTPSFKVNPSKQVFHCFGCGAGGDLFRFLMRLEGMTFPEVVRTLARRAGIALPSSRASGSTQGQGDLREPLFAVMVEAAEYYHRLLREDPQAEAARRYVEARGLTAQTVEEFELGYAPAAWDSLLRELTRRGRPPALLEQAGLIVSRREGGGYYDVFRDRLIFPIHDLQGRVIGFGGRLLGPGEPKYLNSPETPLYRKSRTLYAFERAKGPASRPDARVVLVEGYMDALMAHQAGVSNVAATLGTALSADHLHLIRRFTSRIAILFDPDPAGLAAMIRLAPLVIESDLAAEVVSWAGGEDPDEFIRHHGREAFCRAIEASVGLMDFVITEAVREIRPERIEDKSQVASRLLPLIMRLKSIEQDHYLHRLSEALGVKEQSLRAEAKRQAGTGTPGPGRRAASAGGFVSAPGPGSAAGPTPPTPKEEELLLHLIVHGMVDPPGLGLMPEAFTDPGFRRVAERLFQAYAAEGRIDVGGLTTHEQDEEIVRILSALAVQAPTYEDPGRVLRDCCARMQQRRTSQELKTLQGQLQEAEQRGDHGQVQVLQRAMEKLMDTRREVMAS